MNRQEFSSNKLTFHNHEYVIETFANYFRTPVLNGHKSSKKIFVIFGLILFCFVTVERQCIFFVECDYLRNLEMMLRTDYVQPTTFT